MPALQIRDLPEATYRKLVERARREHRSLSQQATVLLERALDAPTEWFRDPSGSLYLWTKGSDNPANHNVEAKRRDYAFDLRGRSHVVVDGFNIFASTIVTGKPS